MGEVVGTGTRRNEREQAHKNGRGAGLPEAWQCADVGFALQMTVWRWSEWKRAGCCSMQGMMMLLMMVSDDFFLFLGNNTQRENSPRVWRKPGAPFLGLSVPQML